jgi:ribosomal-protein-alanine N-acetyltransferase
VSVLTRSTAMISTERLQIVPFEERHLTERYVSWLNDAVVTRYSEQRHRVHTLQSCAAYLQSFKNMPSRFLAIETRVPPQRHIGNITVAIDPANSVADISIMIGERSVWGQGYGLEAWSAVLNDLLGSGRMRKVTGGAVCPNVAMIVIMRKCGMIEDGVRHRHLVIDGEPTDVLHFAAFSRGSAQTSGDVL